jgi:hypothetical protein
MLFGVNVSIALYCMFAYGPAMARQAALYAAASVISVAGYLKLIGSLGMDLNIDFKGMRPDIVTAVKRIPGILYEYQIQFFGPKKWNLTWVLFIAAFVAGFRKAFSGALKLPTFAILLALGAYTALYMITPLDFLYHVSKTASRLFLHFLPVVILWLAVYYDEKKLDI